MLDCLDGGDEINCGERLVVDRANVTCKPGEFPCRDQPFCVERTWLCDGEKVARQTGLLEILN